MRAIGMMMVIAAIAAAGCDHKPRPKAEPEPAAKADEAQPDEAKPDEAKPDEAQPSPSGGSGTGTGSGSGSGSGSGPGTGTGSGSAAGSGAGVGSDAQAAADLRAKNPELFDKCGAAAQYALGLALAETPPESKARALQDQPAQMQSMREQCVNQAWSADLLGCITGAKNVDALVACQKFLPGRTGP